MTTTDGRRSSGDQIAASIHGYRVMAIKPLWRWAVAPANGSQVGIPYYRKAAALACLDEIRRELPWSPTVLLRKRFRRVEVVDE